MSLQRSISMSPSKREASPPKEVRFDSTAGKDKLAKLSHKFCDNRPSCGEYKLSLRRTNTATQELEALDDEGRLEHIMNLMEKPKQLKRSMSLSRRSFQTADYSTMDIFPFQKDVNVKKESELNVLERYKEYLVSNTFDLDKYTFTDWEPWIKKESKPAVEEVLNRWKRNMGDLIDINYRLKKEFDFAVWKTVKTELEKQKEMGNPEDLRTIDELRNQNELLENQLKNYQ